MSIGSKTQYLIRLDDICPTMNWGVWDEIEMIVSDRAVKPIVAVIPDNRDSELKVDPPRANFWDRVRHWKAKGWTIAMHGYQHRYVTKKSGMLRLHRRSEFAGLPWRVQEAKLEHAMEIFRREGIEPGVWIAPSHSFDWTTVRILHNLGICIISDGLSRFPYRDGAGILWVPQQIWRFRAMPSGTWTVCLHHNRWTSRDLESFRSDVEAYGQQVTSFAQVCHTYGNRRRTVSDRVLAATMFCFFHSMRPARLLQRTFVR